MLSDNYQDLTTKRVRSPWRTSMLLVVWYGIGFACQSAQSQEDTQVSQSPVASNPAPTNPAQTNPAQTNPAPTKPEPQPPAIKEPAKEPTPWEYKPYNMRLWLTTDSSKRLEQVDFLKTLQRLVERDVQGAWDITYAPTPRRFAGALARDFERVSYDLFAGEDLILIVNANTEVGRPIRTPKLAAGLPHTIPTTRLIAEGLRDAKDEGVKELVQRLEVVEDVDKGMIQPWIDREIYAMVISRDMLPMIVKRMPVNSPQPRVIDLPIEDQFIDIANQVDKLMMLRVTTASYPLTVEAIEIDGLLRTAGPVVKETATGIDELPAAAARAMLRAFAPLIRIEDAGAKTAKGRVRARGLLRFADSPIAIQSGQTLQPWIRKDDRNGRPQTLGILDWTYGIVKSVDAAKIEMDIFSGRSGGLQGKQSKRLHRLALRVRPAKTPACCDFTREESRIVLWRVTRFTKKILRAAS